MLTIIIKLHIYIYYIILLAVISSLIKFKVFNFQHIKINITKYLVIIVYIMLIFWSINYNIILIKIILELLFMVN